MTTGLTLKRPTNAAVRDREYLTPDEVERLMKAARSIGRHGHRDATMILVAFRHGLRLSELVELKWSQVLLNEARLSVVRKKGGISGVHPLYGVEIRALRRVMRDYPETTFVFVTERKGPLTASTFQKLVKRAGEKADIGIPIHPHMLRHSCGFKLANEGVDTRAIQIYLGHRDIKHTMRYTELASNRFANFWTD
ncbi:Tyrosine-type recombinase/integrase [Sulfidibacter corallicola]|uniref:Tyrosine-type recombinase/integrase n=1 Tax=Sulfidibacter corallicola TaxID=2818388 RepID=A0A8A4TKB4_SULCO|nr:tyrosine-type recombinase/integrase [Sulfidibacter corallicola]QTD49644.1 tyrosine-type recombinase/integrase [Sulfidibacter corallicola]